MTAALPRGFVQFTLGSTTVVADETLADAVREALRSGTLYDYARLHVHARPLAGRGTAYAVNLPHTKAAVVVRHNRHGGLLAPLTRDLFLPPSLAPYELATSERLRSAGVPTPRIAAYAVYPALAVWRRADVASHVVPDAFDLSAALLSSNADYRRRALAATASLVRALAAAGARHHDLNVKNVLLREIGPALEAMVLDVDRVVFTGASADDLVERNLARLARSARKWQRERGARVTDAELVELRDLCRASNNARPLGPS
jgi:hypothetical protein